MRYTKYEKDLMRLPPLIALSGMFEDMLGTNFVFQNNVLNHEQYVILVHLDLENGPVKMKDVAHLLLKSPSSATIHVDEMVQNGLLERIPGTEDRRVLFVSMTEKGGKLLEETRSNVLKFMKQICEDISTEELEITINVLMEFINKSEILMNIDLKNFMRLIK